MIERNRASLERAIRQLPDYEPAKQSWQKIAGELDRQRLELPLRAALQKLPAYEAPGKVWESIATSLDQPADRRRHLRPYRRYAAAAAAILLLVAGSWFFISREQAPTVEIVYSEEWVDEPSLENDWHQDDVVFEEIGAMLSANPLLQDNTEYHSLQQELQALEEARKAIEQLMQTYGQDADLIREMSKLERARTDLLQEMVAMI